MTTGSSPRMCFYRTTQNLVHSAVARRRRRPLLGGTIEWPPASLVVRSACPADVTHPFIREQDGRGARHAATRERSIYEWFERVRRVRGNARDDCRYRAAAGKQRWRR